MASPRNLSECWIAIGCLPLPLVQLTILFFNSPSFTVDFTKFPTPETYQGKLLKAVPSFPCVYLNPVYKLITLHANIFSSDLTWPLPTTELISNHPLSHHYLYLKCPKSGGTYFNLDHCRTPFYKILNFKIWSEIVLVKLISKPFKQSIEIFLVS